MIPTNQILVVATILPMSVICLGLVPIPLRLCSECSHRDNKCLSQCQPLFISEDNILTARELAKRDFHPQMRFGRTRYVKEEQEENIYRPYSKFGKRDFTPQTRFGKRFSTHLRFGKRLPSNLERRESFSPQGRFGKRDRMTMAYKPTFTNDYTDSPEQTRKRFRPQGRFGKRSASYGESLPYDDTDMDVYYYYE